MSIEKKRPLSIINAEPSEINRVLQNVYDDINEIINAVNSNSQADSNDRTLGKQGDLKLIQNNNKSWEIHGKTDDGWVFASTAFKDKLGGSSAGIKTVSADTTLSSADSGKTILMGANGVDITLPSAFPGLEFQIIQSADYSTAVCTIVQASASEDFYGAVYGSTQGENAGTDADVGASANTKITFSNASLKGDRVRLVSDGTGWYVEAFAQVYNGITFDN